MMKVRGKFLISLTLLLSLWNTSVVAQEDTAPAAKKKQLPKSGSLSSSGTLGTGDHAVGLPWGSDAIRGGAPVSGSVSKANEKQWTLKLFNNSKDTYDVNLSVMQFNERKVRVKTDHYSYKLGPRAKTQRQVSSAIGAAFAELSLDSWKKTAAPPTAEELARQEFEERLAREGVPSGLGANQPPAAVKPTPQENPEEFLGNMGYQGN